MIKAQHLKVGDYVLASFEGSVRRGQVTELNREDQQIRVRTDEQEFWYEAKDLEPIPLNEQELFGLGFQKQLNGEGSAKYLRGPFRVQLARDGDFSEISAWYREDKRQWKQPLALHELQNHYLEMTKVELQA